MPSHNSDFTTVSDALLSHGFDEDGGDSNGFVRFATYRGKKQIVLDSEAPLSILKQSLVNQGVKLETVGLAP